MNTRTVSLLIGFATLQSSGAAMAEATQDDKAAAEALYESGKSLLKVDVAAACEKFAASQQLDPGVGTLLHLGACYEKLGKIASAWGAFREAESYARRSGQPDREKIATQRAEKLEQRLPKLVIDTSRSAASSLSVTRDGKPLVPALYGVPIPVDPGPHVVAVSAPGKQPWQATIELAEGKTEMLEVPPLEATPEAAPPVPAPATSAAATPRAVQEPPAPAPPHAPAPMPGLSTRAKVGIGVGAVGAVSLVLGSYFGLRARSKWHDAQDHCEGLACDGRGVDLALSASADGNVSTALFAAGAVALGTGAYLVLSSSPRRESRVSLGATRGGALLSWEGKL